MFVFISVMASPQRSSYFFSLGRVYECLFLATEAPRFSMCFLSVNRCLRLALAVEEEEEEEKKNQKEMTGDFEMASSLSSSTEGVREQAGEASTTSQLFTQCSIEACEIVRRLLNTKDEDEDVRDAALWCFGMFVTLKKIFVSPEKESGNTLRARQKLIRL